MKHLSTIILLAITAALAGCAATVQQQAGPQVNPPLTRVASERVALLVQANPAMAKSDDWELFRAEWRSAMAEASAAAGKQFTYHDVEPPAGVDAGLLVVVTINDYRYISAGARYGLGIMTGNAYIDADARFYAFPGRRQLGQRKYTTSSSAWQGVFSAMTDKQVRAISTEIVRELE